MEKLDIYNYIINQKKKIDLIGNEKVDYSIKYIPILCDEKVAIFNNSKFIYFNDCNSLILKLNEYCIKIILFYSDINYSINNPYSEIEIMKILKNFVESNNTPHINIPLIYSYCSNFYKQIKNVDLISYKKINNKINLNRIKDNGLFIITDWYNSGNLSSYSTKNILNESEWKIIIFKIIFTLAIIQDKYPSFRHNDLSFNNILVKKSTNVHKLIYKYNNTIYVLPNVGYEIYINDFEYSNISNTVINKEIQFNKMPIDYGIRNKQNRYYDLHYFLNSLFFSDKLSENTKKFIKKYIPPQYLSRDNYYIKNFRLIPDIEYTRPSIILKDDFFLEFITKKPIFSKKKYNFL